MRKKTLGQYLKDERLHSGYSISHASLLSGLNYSTITKIESGQSDVDVSAIGDLCKAYDIYENLVISKAREHGAVLDGKKLLLPMFFKADWN